MPRKVFQIQVELDIQAVSCPGVWLCPSGNVSLQLFMLGSCVQTRALEPAFPMLFHEKFVFYKLFYQAQSLSQLQKFINKEIIYFELIQWRNNDTGNVLATFESSLGQLLYPMSHEGVVAGVDVDLLTEPSRTFPGIIAPKIEVSTRTTIEETVYRVEYKHCSSYVINPKIITSNSTNRTGKTRQSKVCHSMGYHRSRKSHTKHCRKPPFVCRRVSDNLIGRKIQGLGGRKDGSTGDNYCDDDICCCTFDSANDLHSKISAEFLRKYPNLNRTSRSPVRRRKDYSSAHIEPNCEVCSKYLEYFDRVLPSSEQKQNGGGEIKQFSSPLLPQRCLCRQEKFRTAARIAHNHHVRKLDDEEVEKRTHIPRQLDKECDCHSYNEQEIKQMLENTDRTSTVRNLTTQMHDKLKNTLKNCSGCLCGSDLQEIASGCLSCEDNICNKKRYYDNLEQFYTKLLGKSHTKSTSRRRGRCPSPPID